ncbi:hypothetical protein QK140_003837 [Yersinia enterocolitica]|nr:hypothetical protein [Yersinia enterocolitica]
MECNENSNVEPDFLFKKIHEDNQNWDETLLELIDLHNTHSHKKEVQDLIIRCLDRGISGRVSKAILNHLLDAVGLLQYKEYNESVIDQFKKSLFSTPMANNYNNSVFHLKQAEVYNRIIDGESIILSAPTSFGKSLIIEALIASNKYNNIAIVVPTISLIDELKKKYFKYSDAYKIITQTNQPPGSKNIFIYTQERVIEKEEFPLIDIFIIDEFYKLNPRDDVDERSDRLNIAFLKLFRLCQHFYMLGPNIESISVKILDNLSCNYISYPDFITVSTNEISYALNGETEVERDFEREIHLTSILENSKDQQTIIYCKSPKRATYLTRIVMDMNLRGKIPSLSGFSEWLKATYNEDWSLAHAINYGIAAHHAKLPRSVASYIIHLFNRKEIKILICTSTIIEGVNTNAKNVIIYDDCIARNVKLDKFTFNNIAGRSGRMFEHYVGNVHIIGDKPPPTKLEVDIPIISQSDKASDSLLLQIHDILDDKNKIKLNRYFLQQTLSIETINKNNGIDPDLQISFAEDIIKNFQSWHRVMKWTGLPNTTELRHMSFLLVKYFNVKKYASGVIKNESQLNKKIINIIKHNSIKNDIIQDFNYFHESDNEYDIDDAILRNFDFRRQMVSHYIPMFISAINNIQREIFPRFGHEAGDYSTFAKKLECHFTIPSLMTLEEFGIPISVADKLNKKARINDEDNIDEAIYKLKGIDLSKMQDLCDFEIEILKNSFEYF